MKKEIIYRGKSTENNGWLFGNFANLMGRHFIISPSNELGKIEPVCIYADTLGEYIGINDNSESPIYEGDILKITGSEKPGKYLVIWDDYRCAWWGKNIRKEREMEYDDDYIQLLGGIFQKPHRKIIGNMHDNPEMLVTKKKKVI